MLNLIGSIINKAVVLPVIMASYSQFNKSDESRLKSFIIKSGTNIVKDNFLKKNDRIANWSYAENRLGKW